MMRLFMGGCLLWSLYSGYLLWSLYRGSRPSLTPINPYTNRLRYGLRRASSYQSPGRLRRWGRQRSRTRSRSPMIVRKRRTREGTVAGRGRLPDCRLALGQDERGRTNSTPHRCDRRGPVREGGRLRLPGGRACDLRRPRSPGSVGHLPRDGAARDGFLRDAYTALPEMHDRPLFIHLDVHYRKRSFQDRVPTGAVREAGWTLTGDAVRDGP